MRDVKAEEGRNLAREKLRRTLRRWAALCSLAFVFLFTQIGQGAAVTNPFTFSSNTFLTGDYVVFGGPMNGPSREWFYKNHDHDSSGHDTGECDRSERLPLLGCGGSTRAIPRAARRRSSRPAAGRKKTSNLSRESSTRRNVAVLERRRRHRQRKSCAAVRLAQSGCAQVLGA